MLVLKKDLGFDLRLFLSYILAVLVTTVDLADGYTTVSISRLCRQHESVALDASSATGIILEASKPCRIEVTAPPTHHVSFLFTQRRRAVERALLKPEAHRTPCLLTISYPVPRVEEDIKTTVDLCSVSALETMKYTEMLPPLLTLDWAPGNSKTDEILALELVFAAVGRGREECSQSGQFPCMVEPHYPIYCVASELVCDGRPNCPYSGNDEEKELCRAGGSFERLAPTRLDESWHLGQGLEYIASEMFKKFVINKNAHPKKHEGNDTMEKVTVTWQDDGKDINSADNFPNILNQYGPWGYLMLGMLICGTVLMFCGLWECCCRRPKSPTNIPGPALLIINQGTQAEIDVPISQAPPRYEDLDQPPSYATLFPVAKEGVFPVDFLPSVSQDRERSVVLSLSSSNGSSSQTAMSSQSTEHNRSQVEIFTIPLRNEQST